MFKHVPNVRNVSAFCALICPEAEAQMDLTPAQNSTYLSSYLVQWLETNEPLLRRGPPEGTFEPGWDEQSEALLINEMWVQLAQVLVDSIQKKKVFISHDTQRDQ